MDDQYFSSAHNDSSFDLAGSGCAPMGFSPSIDALSNLEIPSSFLMELQRKRADTVTTLKPDFELQTPLPVDEDGIEIDIPVRKRALQRLSLASSIASSAPSTSTTDIDGFESAAFDSESDVHSSASPAADIAAAAQWGFTAAPSLADLSTAFASTDRTPDLVHWRSNTTIQACYYQGDIQSPSGSSPEADAIDALAHSADFSFAEFIDEDPKFCGGPNDEGSIQETVNGAQALSINAEHVASPQGPMAAAASSGSIYSDAAPSTPVRHNMALPHQHFSGSFVEPTMHATPSAPMAASGSPHACTEACLAQGPADNFAAHHHGVVSPPVGYPAGSPFQSPGSESEVAAGNWPMPRPPHFIDAVAAPHPHMFPGQPMSFSQSAPPHGAPHMAMYSAGLMGSPVPSSPAFSARSNSPYPTPTRPMFVEGMPSRHQMHNVAGPSSQPMGTAPGSPMSKAQQLVHHLNSMWNPYAGLITKRSRGRRVPSKPEEMNNLGKSGKVYTCKVPGCGKCFKRSEHLKRHVRSIHTDDKPFICPFPTCQKRFSRHDNLNQHARVHASSSSGPSSGEMGGPGPLGQINEDGSPAAYPAAFGMEMQGPPMAMPPHGAYLGMNGLAPAGMAMTANQMGQTEGFTSANSGGDQA